MFPARCDLLHSFLRTIFSFDHCCQREKVEQLILDGDKSYPIVSDNLRKIYPSIDGNPEKVAVQGFSIALPSGECFGMLGPNGAGKTSLISMVVFEFILLF